MRKFVLLLVMFALAFFAACSSSTKPAEKAKLERVEGSYAGYPMVTYIDRSYPGIEISYIDMGMNGSADEVAMEDSKGHRIGRFVLVRSQGLANDLMAKAVMNKSFGEGAALYRYSSAGLNIQSQYVDVRTGYQKEFPTDLAENRVKSEWRDDKVKLFTGLLAEHQKESAKVESAKTERSNEIAQLRTYVVFRQMRMAFKELNDLECYGLFDSNNNRLDPQLIPRGIKLDGGRPVVKIGGISLVANDPLYDFEQFLSDPYMEIDYMSAWSISEESYSISEAYRQELKDKGLLVD